MHLLPASYSSPARRQCLWNASSCLTARLAQAPQESPDIQTRSPCPQKHILDPGSRPPRPKLQHPPISLRRFLILSVPELLITYYFVNAGPDVFFILGILRILANQRVHVGFFQAGPLSCCGPVRPVRQALACRGRDSLIKNAPIGNHTGFLPEAGSTPKHGQLIDNTKRIAALV